MNNFKETDRFFDGVTLRTGETLMMVPRTAETCSRLLAV